MPSVRRRSVLLSTGVAVSGLLAGCNQASGTDDHTTSSADTTTEDQSTSATPTTESSTPQTPNVDDPHPIPLEIRNDGEEPLQVAATIKHDANITFQKTLEVPAWSAVTLEVAYTVPESGNVTYTTSIRVDGHEIGYKEIRVPDYHHTHSVSAEVAYGSVNWGKIIH